MVAPVYDWDTEVLPWLKENRPKIAADWERWGKSKSTTDKSIILRAGRQAYGQYARRLNPEVLLAHQEGQKARWRDDPEYRAQNALRNQKSKIKSSLRKYVIPQLEKLGDSKSLGIARKLFNTLDERGYSITQDDIDTHKFLSGRVGESKKTAKRFRPPYGLTESELQNFHKELWKYEESKRAFNQKLWGLVEDGSISEAKFNRFRLSPGHGLSAATFPEFQAEVNNIFAETLKHNQGAGVRLTGAQVLNRVKSLLVGEGVGIESTTRKRINEFAKLAESKGFNPDFIYRSRHGVEKPFNMNELLRYFTGYGFKGEHGLAGVKKIDPLFKKEPLTPEQQKKLTQKTIENVKGGLMTWGKKAVSKAPLVGALLTPGIAKAYWDEGQKGRAVSSLLGIAGIIPEFLFDWEKMGRGFQESLLRTKEARESRYENLLMDRRHRQRRKELKGQGLLGVNI